MPAAVAPNWPQDPGTASTALSSHQLSRSVSPSTGLWRTALSPAMAAACRSTHNPLLAASVHSSALFPFAAAPDGSLLPPLSPLSARPITRQLFSPLSGQPSSHILLPGTVAPPNTPLTAAMVAATDTTAARGYQSALLPSSGFGQEAPAAHFDQRSARQQQLLRYLADRQTAEQHLLPQHSPPVYPPPQYQPQHTHQRQLLQQGLGTTGSGSGSGSSTLKSLMTVFNSLSSLPPPLSHPPLPPVFPSDLCPSSPRSPSERTTQSTSTSVLCQSPSSTLSSSSYVSLDDVLDYDMESLVDQFQLPVALVAPRRLLSHRLLQQSHSGLDTSLLASSNCAVTAAFPLSNALTAMTAQSPHTLDDVPALPVSGDMPPGSLLWQQEVERHELWNQTTQQLVANMQQHHRLHAHRPQQPHYDEQPDSSEDATQHGEQNSQPANDSQRAAIVGVRGSSVMAGSSSSSSSSSSSEDSHGRRVKRERSVSDSSECESELDEADSECSSMADTERSIRGRGGLKHKAKRSRGSSKRKASSRSKRGKGRRSSQCSEESSDSDDSDSEQEQQQQHKGRAEGGAKSVKLHSVDGRVAVENKSASLEFILSRSPHYSPSPSSFSTSTAASSASAVSLPATDSQIGLPGTTWLSSSCSPPRSVRRPCGVGHRSKLPARVVAVLRAFFLQHVSHPFPSEEQKRELVGRTELSMKQVCDWFTNNRKRYWKPYERKMDKMRCGLVSAAYKAAQQPRTAAHNNSAGSGRRSYSSNRSRSNRQADRVERERSVQRTACRCGEDDVAIHDWRQMWD